MKRQLLKGNTAVVKGAVLAGCDAFYGYPITPASEIAEAAAEYLPKAGGTFLQAESEIAAINMVYGASSGGARVMTASSGPGISLKSEGISYMAGAELPCVIVSIVRGGPGLGNIAPEQSDYNQIVKGGGHGNYHSIVLAPNSVQEMFDFGKIAFNLADKYRTPVFIMADGFIGQMMEPVEIGEPDTEFFDKTDWSVEGTEETRDNLITSIHLDPDDLEDVNKKLQEKYNKIEQNEVRYEEITSSDDEMIVVSFGITSRIVISAVEQLREEGVEVGFFRPQTLFPFPNQKINALADQVDDFLVVELNNGQMVNDVKRAINGKASTHFQNRMGGNLPEIETIQKKIKQIIG